MAFEPGNKFWRLRSIHGRDKLFENPELLWQAACEYFEWCVNNPLKQAKAFAIQGEVITVELPVMRAFSREQLCLYLGCNEAYFRQFKSTAEHDFSTVISDIEQTIDSQQFQGAAGNLLNANIISRKLGLTDKSDITSNGNTIVVPAWLKDNPDGSTV